MHENIKFTIKLSSETQPINNAEQVRNDPFRLADTPEKRKAVKSQIADWQPIFSDVKYGTEHTLYAKFIGSGDKDHFKVRQIQLYIQNYSGPVTIGFNSADVQIRRESLMEGHPDIDVRLPTRTQYVMTVGLEGLKENVSDLFKLNETAFINMDHSSLSSISETKPLELKEGDTLRVETWFSPANPAFTGIYTDRESLKDSPFVDELFMERLGEDVVVSWRGLRELEWINTKYGTVVNDEQLKAAGESRTKAPENYISTRESESDWTPCKSVYSRFLF